MKTLLNVSATIATGSYLATAKNPLPQDGLTQAGVQLSGDIGNIGLTAKNPLTTTEFPVDIATSGSDATITADFKIKPDYYAIINWMDNVIVKANNLKTQNFLRIGTGANKVLTETVLTNEDFTEFLIGLGFNNDDVNKLINSGFTGPISTKMEGILLDYINDFSDDQKLELHDKNKELIGVLQNQYDNSEFGTMDALSANLTAEGIASPVLGALAGLMVILFSCDKHLINCVEKIRCNPCNPKTRKEKITDLKKEKSALNDKIKAKKVKLKAEKAKVQALYSNTAPLIAKQKQQEAIKAIEKELEELRVQRASLQDEIIKAITKISADKGLNEIRTQILKTQDAIENKNKNKNKIPSYLTSRLQALEDQHEKLEKRMNPTVTRLMEINKTQANANKTLTDINQDQSNQLQTKDGIITDLESQLQTKDGRITYLESQLQTKDGRITYLESQINEAKQPILGNNTKNLRSTHSRSAPKKIV